MIRLDAASGIIRVDVEGVQMCADLLYGSEILDCGGAGFEDGRFEAYGVAWDAVGLRER